jgi:hypothetical protein
VCSSDLTEDEQERLQNEASFDLAFNLHSS